MDLPLTTDDFVSLTSSLHLPILFFLVAQWTWSFHWSKYMWWDISNGKLNITKSISNSLEHWPILYIHIFSSFVFLLISLISAEIKCCYSHLEREECSIDWSLVRCENRKVSCSRSTKKQKRKWREENKTSLRNLRIDVYMLLIDSFGILTCFYSMFDSVVLLLVCFAVVNHLRDSFYDIVYMTSNALSHFLQFSFFFFVYIYPFTHTHTLII